MAIIDPAFLNRLSRRERQMLVVGGITVLAFGLWGLVGVFQWYQDRMTTLDRLVREKTEARATLVQLRQEYMGLKGEIAKLEKQISRQGSFSLLSVLESMAGKLGMRSNIAHMRPQPDTEIKGYREVGVEVKLQNVTLEQAVRMLCSIENAPHLVRVKRLRMKTRFADPQFLDTTFLAITYENM